MTPQAYQLLQAHPFGQSPRVALPDEEGFRSALGDIDIDNLPEKPWAKEGANLEDYFNYGFTEETWRVRVAREARDALVCTASHIPHVPATAVQQEADSAAP